MSIIFNKNNIFFILLLTYNFVFCSDQNNNNNNQLLLNNYLYNGYGVNESSFKKHPRYIFYYFNLNLKQIQKFLINKDKQNAIKIFFKEYSLIQKEDHFFKLFANIKYTNENLKLFETEYSNFDKKNEKYFDEKSKLAKSQLFKQRRKKSEDQCQIYIKIEDCKKSLKNNLKKIDEVSSTKFSEVLNAYFRI